ncbi:unnamed protein product [Lota lota]
MSNDLPLLTRLTENSTEAPVSAGGVENYVLLLVLGVFVGGTLALLSLLVLFCHICCMGGRHYSRASEDPEKTNTTYVEDSQPTPEITVPLDESDAFPSSSCQEGKTERFVSACPAGRRVSFNESALYEQEEKTEDKGRRYTLTEGDFHHLKKARLTHLNLAPTHTAMKIHTITEWESTESSIGNINEMPADRLPLTIYQPTERGEALSWVGQSLSGGLPGNPHHSVILEQGNRQIAPAAKFQHTHSLTLEAIGDRGGEDNERGRREEWEVSPAQTSVLQFFSKLRRHASLEGAGPYFRKWKFDSSRRAASLDAKGSPKRRPFQRQRAASETTDHTGDDSSSLGGDVTPPHPPPHLQSGGLQSLSAESLTQASTPCSSSAFLHRLEVEVWAEMEVGINITGGKTDSPLPNYQYAQRQELGTGDGAEEGSAVETETEVNSMFPSWDREARAELAPGDNDTEDDLFMEHDDLGIRGCIKTASQSNTVTGVNSCDVIAHVRRDLTLEAEEGDEEVLGSRRRTDSGSPLSFLLHQDSTELPHSLYRDIWSLRASLEQYASSDQSSTDRESIRSDADSLSSLGAAGARYGLDSCLSQDLGDELEVDGEGEGIGSAARGEGEAASGTAGDVEVGNRKLLQMDSGYASIEAPSRAPEDLRLFGMPGGPRGKTASERRLFFTNSRRKGSVCESFEAKVLQEEQEDEMIDHTYVERKFIVAATPGSQSLTIKQASQPGKVTYSQNPLESFHLQSKPTSPLVKPRYSITPQPSPNHRPRLRRRDYSIDEKTDALFNEFLRHDPRFDQQDSPPRARHRSRVHLRKQWQRHKQYSDPGSSTGGRYSPSLERQRFTPLRRGDSAGYPLDTRYHSTLSRIASAADEEATEVAACEEANQEGMEEDNGLHNERNSQGAVESVSNEASEDHEGSNAGAHSTAAIYRVTDSEVNDTEGETVANERTSSRLQDTLHTQASYMEPRVGNQNNNSSQAIKSHFPSPEKHRSGTLSTDVSFVDPTALMPILCGQSSLTDKMSVEERLYSGLRNARPGHLGLGEGQCVVAVSHVCSPDRSPV